MVPNVGNYADQDEKLTKSTNLPEEKIDYEKPFFKRKDVKWLNVAYFVVLHAIALYATLTFPFLKCWKTTLFGYVWMIYGGLGVTAGAHRYWAHKCFKANILLRIFLMTAFVSTGESTLYVWVRDHRAHHKWSDTDADPYNSRRGLFFSHVGWLMVKRHPELLRKGKLIDMSDIDNEPVAAFANKHYVLLHLLFCFVIPFVIPVYFWNERYLYSALMVFLRWTMVLNATFSVNSFAHAYGYKPYDKNIVPVENKYVAYASLGEGWHNYHHTFPNDYRAAEIGGGRSNFTTKFIDFFAKIGWAWDLKHPSDSLVRSTVEKRGDKNNIEAKDY